MSYSAGVDSGEGCRSNLKRLKLVERLEEGRILRVTDIGSQKGAVAESVVKLSGWILRSAAR